MPKLLLTIGLIVVLLSLPAFADPPDKKLPEFSDEIHVLGEQPFVAAVDLGQPVYIVFGIGELDIEASDQSEVRAEIEVRCRRKMSPERCENYRRKLKIEPRQTDQGLEVRLGGLRARSLRRMGIEGKVTVPRWSPLNVRIGIGDVDIRSGNKDLSVRMKIGDLTIHAPETAVGSVSVSTRIGDASISVPGTHVREKRRMLIGARSSWRGGQGDADIAVGLRIGSASVILE